jgi:4-carboxymuconolactone decarboxylase
MKRLTASLLALAAISPASAGEAPLRHGGPLEIARIGAQPSVKGDAENFTGEVKVEARFQQSNPARVGGATVTFQPGARTAWHTHPLGQTLIVTAGIGWVQREGGPRQTIQAGDVVLIPPQAKHWHGATAGSAMTHVAVAESLNGSVVTWMEHVTNEQYRATSAAVTREKAR